MRYRHLSLIIGLILGVVATLIVIPMFEPQDQFSGVAPASSSRPSGSSVDAGVPLQRPMPAPYRDEKSRKSTLQIVYEKGYVQCGVSQGLPGFSNPDDRGDWRGIDVDVCRAIAAAVLGDARRVKFTSLSAKERFTALQSGEIDILSRNTTWTLTRDTSLGLDFVGVTYYDGQGFLVRKEAGLKSVYDLKGAAICTNTGTTTELNVADFFRTHNIPYQIVAFEKSDEVIAAYDAGRCDAYTTDASGLYAERLKLNNMEDHMVLPELISKEPLGPVVRQGDDQWADIARWSLYAMISAEELGLTQKNVKSFLETENPEIRRFLGVESSFGESLGLKNDWALNIVSQVGNYGESFERNLGKNTRLGIERGLNALWTDGGLMYAPPVR